jgi:hypothetical protein
MLSLGASWSCTTHTSPVFSTPCVVRSHDQSTAHCKYASQGKLVLQFVKLYIYRLLQVIELMSIDDAWKALQSMLEGMLEACRMTESSNILDIMV